MKRPGFFPLTAKVNLIIIVSLVAGIGLFTFILGRAQYLELELNTMTNLHQQAELLYTSIENIMLPGEAPLAVTYFKDVKERGGDFDIALYRRDGMPAFSDNSTIRAVNKNIGRDKFAFRPAENTLIEMNRSDGFAKSLGPVPTTATALETEEGRVFYRLYKPLINKPKCTGCHGSDHTVRGVIDIRHNVTLSVRKQRNAIALAGGSFVGMVAILSVVLGLFFKHAIIRPIQLIGRVCGQVSGGNFEVSVRIRNSDEIGRLGDTVNGMIQGLHERFKLSKFVSSSTLRSLSKATERGERVTLTLFFSDIRGFTAFSEKRQPEEVVEILNRILSIQTEIIHRHGGDVDKYVGDEIVAVFRGEGDAFRACSAACEIQKSLPSLSGELSVGIGINSGPVILGMVGSEQRADFTVIGDNVNAASRLCSAAKAGEVIVSEAAVQRISDGLSFRGPFSAHVKGKDQALRVYYLVIERGEA